MTESTSPSENASSEPVPDAAEASAEPYILSDETIPEQEYAPFYRRVARDIGVLGVVTFLIAFKISGLEAAGGLALGAVVAGVNFWWMQRSIAVMAGHYVEALAGLEKNDAAIKPNVPIMPQAVRFFLRYLLIGSVAFVIIKSHHDAALGFFGGMALPIAALMVESFRLFISSPKPR